MARNSHHHGHRDSAGRCLALARLLGSFRPAQRCSINKRRKRKKKMMPRQLKVNACLTFVLAVMFYLFFQISKHQPALSQVNAFAEDPYDAVGSFGTQFAVFTALLSLVRAFRPYQPNKALDGQKVHLVRAEYLTYLSVFVGLECSGILLGYAFLAKPLGLFRQE